MRGSCGEVVLRIEVFPEEIKSLFKTYCCFSFFVECQVQDLHQPENRE
jgi:hypothetical protein